VHPNRIILSAALTLAALPTFAVESLSAGQLEAASRVHTGAADCEFNQKVSLTPLAGQPGHFKLGYKQASYTVVPQETSTGAVRLEDRKAGIVWLQIPSKSMLMNAKVGQRLVDGCTHAEQRADQAAQASGTGATTGTIGIAVAPR
jgi:hypothetical protein